MKPVLILDIDGVLVAYPEGEHTAPQFTPRCVEALKSIIASVPRLTIVFSTTWRLPLHVNRLHEQWTFHGLPIDIAWDGTPDLRDDPAVPLRLRRGWEIRAWLTAHPAVTRWCVIDDDRMAIEEVVDTIRCIFPNPQRGLTGDLAEVAVSILEMDGVPE